MGQELNFEEDIRIDESALDVEWLLQPELMMNYSREAAKARKRVDKSKEALDVVKAELDRDIRSNPENYGISKITESVVSNTIILAEEYQEAAKDLIQAKYEADLTSSAVRAVEQRKNALENMVKLHGQQYFAGPIEPRNITREAQKKREKENSNEKVKVKRKKKHAE